MSLHPTLRSDLGHLHGRRVSLAAPLPAMRSASQVVIDLNPTEWQRIPAHIAAAELAKERRNV